MFYQRAMPGNFDKRVPEMNFSRLYSYVKPQLLEILTQIWSQSVFGGNKSLMCSAIPFAQPTGNGFSRKARLTLGYCVFFLHCLYFSTELLRVVLKVRAVSPQKLLIFNLHQWRTFSKSEPDKINRSRWWFPADCHLVMAVFLAKIIPSFLAFFGHLLEIKKKIPDEIQNVSINQKSKFTA